MKKRAFITLFFIWVLYFAISGQLTSDTVNHIVFDSLKRKAETFLLIHPDTTIYYSKLLLNNIKFPEDDTSKASLFLIMAQAYERKGEMNQAEKFSKKALEIYDKKNHIQGQIACLNILGNVELKRGNFDKSLKYLRKSMLWAARTQNHKLLAEAFNIIANVYLHSQQFDKAKVFYEQSLKIFTTISDSIGIAYVLNNLASVYIKTNKFDVCIQLLENAREIASKKHFPLLESNILNNLGHIHALLRQYAKAEKYMLQAIQSARKHHDMTSLTSGLSNITYVYLQTNQLNKAKAYLDSAILTAKTHHITHKLPIIYRNYSIYYDKIGDYKQAYNYYTLYHTLYDSLLNERFALQAQQFEQEFQELRKKQEIALKEKENQILKIKNERKNLIILFFISISILMIITIGMLTRMIILKRRQNKQLQTLNEEMNNKHQQLLMLQKSLEEALHAKDTFLSILSHDLRNPCASIISYIRTIRRNHNKISTDEYLGYLSELEQSVMNMHSLLENLLLWSKATSGKIMPHYEILNIYQMITDIYQLYEQKFIQKQMEFRNEIQNPTFLVADRNLLQTILRNLIDNAIKYTPEGGYIQVTFEQNEQWINISVIDSGIGFPEEIIQQISTGKSLQYKKTSDYSTGLGLLICQEFALMHQGYIEIHSEYGAGSRVTINLKKLSPE